MNIEDAVRAAVGDADPVLAAQALNLARILDDVENSATSRSLANKELRETMAEIRALNPPKKEPDAVDEISAQREKRRAAVGGAASSDLPRS